MKLTAQEVMNPNPIVVSPDLSVEDLARILLEHNVDGVCVVENDKLVGVVTTMDLVFQEKNVHIPTFITIMDAVIPLESNQRMREEMEKMAGTWVRDVMTTKSLTVNLDTPLSDAATLMVEKHISIVPVMDQQKLVGVITKQDILRQVFGLL